MRRGDVVLTAAAACGLLAAAGFGALALAGHPIAGLALGLGLLIGGSNGLLARRALGAEFDFRFTSLGRLGLLTLAGVAAGALLGMQVVPLVLIGIGVAQLVLAGAAFREALRA